MLSPTSKADKLKLLKIRRDFEVILGGTESVPSPFAGDANRYGTLRPSPVTYRDGRHGLYAGIPAKYLADELLALNRFLLDGMVNDSLKCGYVSGRSAVGLFRVSPPDNTTYLGRVSRLIRPRIRPDMKADAMIHEVARTAVEIRIGQLFHDGHHRTATLFLYEALHALRIPYRGCPLKAYFILSIAGELGVDAGTFILYEFIKKSTHSKMKFAHYHEAVKRIPIWASITYNTLGILFDKSISLQARRRLVHHLRCNAYWMYAGLALVMSNPFEMKGYGGARHAVVLLR